ncbi:MAG: hypothetical protein Q9209_000948 [Squamulea sp. 1 TL-2023]
MASIRPSKEPGPPAEDMDDMFDYTVDKDVFLDVDVNMDAPSERQPMEFQPKDSGNVLGLDEQVKIIRKRQPVAKLDENRLLSQAGIPKLRRIAKNGFQFKGKGHEYRDLARLLNIYQLWLDDLYPRAKFADGLAMIEKLGHKKRIQIMRREWIHEGKPHEKDNDLGAPQKAPGTVPQRNNSGDRDTIVSQDKIFEASSTKLTPNLSQKDQDTASQQQNATEVNHATEKLYLPNNDEDDQPPEDDLDTLLAETADGSEGSLFGTSNSARPQNTVLQNREFDFEDEMEAMNAWPFDN